MTAFLASVRDDAEAETAIAAGADILDLKDPSAGALGALSLAAARGLVARIAGRRPVSATVGDLPMRSEIIVPAVEAMGRTGVDIVKVGLFPGDGAVALIGALAPLAERGLRIVLVGFADCPLCPGWIEAAREAGITGVMLDTADKAGGALRACLSRREIADFVLAARYARLTVGLAGSLGLHDVEPLLALDPDVLGFRGALCHGGRAGRVDPDACSRLRRAIPCGTVEFTARVA